MKKIFVLGSVLALAACGFSKEDIAMHDADFVGCERIDTSKLHLVYKCPSNMEWIQAVKQQEPTAQFRTGRGFDWDAVNADVEHTLVEVASGSEGGYCKENFHYRTIVKPINTEEMYAVVSCKTKAEEKPAEETAK